MEKIKRVQKLLLTASIVLFVVIVQCKGELADTYITEWQGGATGAYCFTFDDGAAGQWQYAVPILNEYDIHATFFLNGASVAAWYSIGQIEHIHVPQMLNIAAAGHEIASHTYNHPNLVDINDADVHVQMSLDQEFFNYYGIHPVSFAYPFARTNERVQAIVGQYVEFARGGYPMVTNSSSWNELNPLDLRWSSNANDHYACVDLAIATRTWAIGVFHKIGQESHIAEPTIEEFSTFVNYIAARHNVGDLWADTFGNIACYIRERYVAVIIKKYDVGTNTIKIYLKVDLGYPYIVPLTLRTNIDEYYIKSIKQSEMPIEYKVINDEAGRMVQYNVIPDSGEVRIELTEQ